MVVSLWQGAEARFNCLKLTELEIILFLLIFFLVDRISCYDTYFMLLFIGFYCRFRFFEYINQENKNCHI